MSAKKNRKIVKPRRRDRPVPTDPLAARRVTGPTPGSVLRRLDDIIDQIEDGRLPEALAEARQLRQRHGDRPEILRIHMAIHQQTGDDEAGSEVAEAWTAAEPKETEAWIMHFQSAGRCGRAAVASLAYQRLQQLDPDHPAAKPSKVTNLIDQEVQQRLAKAGWSGSEGIRRFAKHETAVGCLQRTEFPRCERLCRELIAEVPDFASAYNNLAVALFHQGKIAQAAQSTDATLERFPDNAYAIGLAIKHHFLAGNGLRAQGLADSLLANPPTGDDNTDAMLQAIQSMTFLGRDQDVLTLCHLVQKKAPYEPAQWAMLHHYEAFARYREGDSKAAAKWWKQAVRQWPDCHIAREHLQSIKASDGNVAWNESLAQWLPKAWLEDLINDDGDDERVAAEMTRQLGHLIEPLLDRGEPMGRQFALQLARQDRSDAMTQFLRTYAFGTQGRDADRYAALVELRERGELSEDSVRIYQRGQWRDVRLAGFEIYQERDTGNLPDDVADIIERGTVALGAGDYDAAEEALDEGVRLAPEDYPGARFNRALVWLVRDGRQGQRRAEAEFEDIRRRCPDYLFAPMELARLAVERGDLAPAKEVVDQVQKRKRLHVSEALALFSLQIYLALALDDLQSANAALNAFENVAGPGDLRCRTLRQMIEACERKR